MLETTLPMSTYLRYCLIIDKKGNLTNVLRPCSTAAVSLFHIVWYTTLRALMTCSHRRDWTKQLQIQFCRSGRKVIWWS